RRHSREIPERRFPCAPTGSPCNGAHPAPGRPPADSRSSSCPWQTCSQLLQPFLTATREWIPRRVSIGNAPAFLLGEPRGRTQIEPGDPWGRSGSRNREEAIRSYAASRPSCCSSRLRSTAAARPQQWQELPPGYSWPGEGGRALRPCMLRASGEHTASLVPSPQRGHGTPDGSSRYESAGERPASMANARALLGRYSFITAPSPEGWF